jgi:hypothetical protein
MSGDQELGDPVVLRVFTIESRDVPCRFFKPRSDGDDFRCDYEIVWPDGQARRFYAMGVDSVQALLLAMSNAHADLLTSPEGRRRAITFLAVNVSACPSQIRSVTFTSKTERA